MKDYAKFGIPRFDNHTLMFVLQYLNKIHLTRTLKRQILECSYQNLECQNYFLFVNSHNKMTKREYGHQKKKKKKCEIDYLSFIRAIIHLHCPSFYYPAR